MSMKKLLIPGFFILSGAISSLALGASTGNTEALDSGIFVKLSKKVVPSVVNISTYMTVKSPYGGGPGGGSPDEYLRRFFDEMFRGRGQGFAPPMGPRGGDEDQDEGEGEAQPGQSGGGPNVPKQRAMSLGTGFIIDASGLVLTNNHVVADADEIKISFTEEADEKPTDGVVVGRDPDLDVALIQVKTSRELTAISLGDSDALEVGEYVIAVGNPFGQGHSVTHGIISAVGRLAPDFPLAKYIQTDAPINPGNSGGPLVNLKGEVIGINNAIDQRAQGIGFAIPISVVKKIIPQLRTKGTVTRGYIGVLVSELTPDVAASLGVSKDLRAPFVTHVYPGDPAAKAGIKPYDVFLEFNGKPIHSDGELITAVTSVSVGDKVPVKINRAGVEKTLTLTVAQKPGTQQIADQVKKSKKKEKKQPTHTEAGMSLEDLTPDAARELGVPEKTVGVIVSSVVYGGPADRAGLMRGDLILEVDRKPVKDVDAFYAIVKSKSGYLLRVRRGDPQGGEAFSVVVLDLKEQH